MAFVLDVFIVGVVAKKIAFKLPINKQNKMQMILTISCLMVLGMVTCMSLFGIVIEQRDSRTISFCLSYSLENECDHGVAVTVIICRSSFTCSFGDDPKINKEVSMLSLATFS